MEIKFYTIWAGQAVSLITSAILQMAMIFYLTEETGSAIVLSMIDFTRQVFYPMRSLDRYWCISGSSVIGEDNDWC